MISRGTCGQTTLWGLIGVPYDDGANEKYAGKQRNLAMQKKPDGPLNHDESGTDIYLCV